MILQEQEKTGEALSIFIKLIKIAPDNPKAHYNKGKCLHVTGNLEDAEKALKDALKLDPENADCCFALATVRYLTQCFFSWKLFLHTCDGGS